MAAASTKLKVRKGDLVQMITGKDRGKQGRILEARPDERRVVVENLNMVKRHRRPRPIRQRSGLGGAAMEPGGVIEMAAPVAISNVMLVCPACNRPTRVGIRERQDAKGKTIRVRVCKRADCGQDVDV